MSELKKLRLDNWNNSGCSFAIEFIKAYDLKVYKYLKNTYIEPLNSKEVDTINQYIYGKVGVGKTTEACRLAVALQGFNYLENGTYLKMLVLDGESMLEEMRASFNRINTENTYDQLLEKYKTVPFLILDDIASGTALSEWAITQFSSIIKYRYRQELPTIYTSNCTIKGLSAYFGDGYVAQQLISRITNTCIVRELISSKSHRISK